MAGKVFINYRRDDSIGMAGRLHDRLAQSFGRDKLFMDVDHIPAGVDFVAHLNSQVAACSVLLVVIGPLWLNAKDESGERRLDNPDDFVTIEIAAALARDIRVIPVLVDGARMPKAKELPDSLKPLTRRQAIEVRHAHFGHDAEALVAKMREVLGEEALVASGREAVGDKARGPGQWRVGAIAGVAAVAVLLLIGVGSYAFLRHAVEQRVQQTELKREEERKVLEAEANRKVAQAEQQLAVIKTEQERQARAAEAEEKRKADEAERQRLTAARAEQERLARAAEAEEKRKADEAERQRLTAARAEQERLARAAEAEEKRKADEAERQRLTAARAEQERLARAAAQNAQTPDAAPAAPPIGLTAATAGCDNPNALGVARTIEIDTTGGPGFGFLHFKFHDFLRDREIVLTFDDGPWPGRTEDVLKALADQCTKAVFFAIGKHAVWYPEIMKQVAAAGHTVGTHTWSHRDLSKLSVQEGKDEIEKGIAAISIALGNQPVAPFFQFPALRHPPEMIKYLGERNVGIFSADLNSWDPKFSKPEEVIASVMKELETHGKGIILMHDYHPATAIAAPQLLKKLKDSGYKVVQLVGKTPVESKKKYADIVLKEMN